MSLAFEYANDGERFFPSLMVMFGEIPTKSSFLLVSFPQIALAAKEKGPLFKQSGSRFLRQK